MAAEEPDIKQMHFVNPLVYADYFQFFLIMKCTDVWLNLYTHFCPEDNL